MKRVIFTLLLALLLPAAGITQCNLALKDGTKLKLDINSWNSPLVTDLKFTKQKDEKKDEQVALYNVGILTGQKTPDTKMPLTYSVKKAVTADGDEYTLTTNISGTDYSSYAVCRNDTVFFARNRGPIEVPDGKGGIYGYTIQGVQTLPMKLKVGDVLPSFSDISIILPTSMDMTVKKQVFSHNSTKTTSEFGFATDSRTGESGFGAYTKTTTTAVYKTIDVAVRKTMKSSAHFVHYMNAQVTGEEDVTVNGQKHKAFIIESQSWSKMTTEVDFESADEQVNRQQEGFALKMQGKVDKMMKRRQFTNELGYFVIYKTEWFVPAIGMVKVNTYDSFGAIASITTLAGME